MPPAEKGDRSILQEIALFHGRAGASDAWRLNEDDGDDGLTMDG
jgi:hypothetical protein